MLRTLFAAVLLAASPVALSACGDRTEDARAQGLYALLDRADAAIAAGDMETLFEISTPEPMMDAILEAQGLSEAADKATARKTLRAMLLGMFEQIEITSHGTDRNAIRYVKGAGGATVAFVPMEMSVRAGGRSLTTRGDYVGLQRGGEWFLVNPTDAPTIAMIRRAFPELEGVEIQPAVVE